MRRIEAYNILRKMYDEATEEQRAAISIAMDDIEFADLMPEHYAPVVRCKDCKYRSDLVGRPPYMFYLCTSSNGLPGGVREENFCSYGERKDGDG